jgi:colicin import membrane protein
MLAATDRLDFVPPPAPGLLRALALAVLAHAFLLAALTWGVHWKREAATLSVEAELWSALPQEAAAQAVEVPLPATPEPVPAPVPVPVPVPAPAPKPVPVQAEPAKVDIAIEQEKLRLKKLKEKELLEKKRLQEKEKEKQQKERQTAEEKKKVELEKQKVELEKQRKQALLAKQEAQRIEAQRSDQLKRIAGLAGASGAQGSTGTALQSSGPSASYAGKIVGLIKSNTKYSDPNAGKPTVKVMVRVNSIGSILSRGIVNSSGNKAWEDAVLRAIDKMETLPRDTDGTIPAIVIREGLELTVTL